MTTQRPVPSGEIPDNFTLTPQQKQQRPPPISYLLDMGVYLTSGILPSGQENYFDVKQDADSPENNIGLPLGLPINSFYPSPSDKNGNFTGNELLATYPPWWFNTHPSGYPPELRNVFNLLKESGIFHYENLVGRFSNVSSVSGLAIQDFNIFNPYIHYYPSYSITDSNKGYNSNVSIEYVSDFEKVSPISPY